MNNKLLKKIGIYAGVLLLFIGLAYGFTPEVLDGKIVNQGDIVAWKGMANEAMTHNEAHPEDPTAWSNSMFGGMPTTATIDSYEGDWTDSIYDFLLTGRRPASYLLLSLIGGFLLMLSLGTSTLIAVGGAIAMTFCSYNFQIIEAGHNTKMQAIAYFPWVLAGLIFTYKTALKISGSWKTWLPKTLLGATLFGLALSMQIKANHPQISYYMAMVIFIFAIGLLIYLSIYKEKRRLLKRFFATSAIVLVVGLVGVATNANKLMPTLEYSKSSMRGGSELSKGNKDGLSLDYITEYSYGIEEIPNLMIPNYNGGASHTPLDVDSETGKFFTELINENEAEQIVKDMPTYWGPQPPTGGPMYMGAVTIFLFVLGMILCKGREKWWIFAATVLAIFVAWGNHFMFFTKFCIDNVPMYNKFRAVSMALSVLQITLPMLGFLVLDKIIKENYEKKTLFRAGGIALALTAGFCLLTIMLPEIAGSFTYAKDNERLAGLFGVSYNDPGYRGIIDSFREAIMKDRQALLVADATRSLILILIAAALIALPYLRKEFKSDRSKKVLAVCVIAVVLFDLWGVGKRYLNEEDFITTEQFDGYFKKRSADIEILKDKEHYRVLDTDRMFSSLSSYHHKCIGGYSAAKMQRYQDFLDSLILPEINYMLRNAKTYADVQENLHMLDATSMLNGKYIILDGKVFENPHAYGNCWFVDEVIPAESPDEELGIMQTRFMHNIAVIGEDFAWAREKVNPGSSYDEIYLTYYAPNELRYDFSTESERAAIFSEIYYPAGWKAWIEPAGTYGKVVDGRYQPTDQAQEVDIFRANWILRGVVLPEGEGILIMRFEPESYRTGENVSRISSILLILLLIGSAGAIIWFSRRK